MVAALMKSGFTRDQIEVHEKPALLKDYCGKSTKYIYNDTKDERFKDGDCAHVIIRRKHMGSSHNDMGFYVDKDGNSKTILCDYAISSGRSACANPVAKAEGGYKPWMKKVKREYTAETTVRMFKRQGKVAKRVEGKDGKIRIYAKA